MRAMLNIFIVLILAACGQNGVAKRSYCADTYAGVKLSRNLTTYQDGQTFYVIVADEAINDRMNVSALDVAGWSFVETASGRPEATKDGQTFAFAAEKCEMF